MKHRILISACLLGVCCRYDGCSKGHPAAMALAQKYELIPVCPEQLGGLPTPRPPAERQHDRVVNRAGQDVTAQYKAGGTQAVHLAKLFGCRAALLKAKSPACGNTHIYDGSFGGVLVPGQGVAAQQLSEAGIAVFNETQLAELEGFFDAK